MKRIVHRAISLVGRRIAAAQIRWISRNVGDRPVLVLDIDNTLADAWPSFQRPSRSERERLASLCPLPGMQAATIAVGAVGTPVVVYLSHRALWHWGITRAWLRGAGYDVPAASLILVSDPSEKVAHLRALCRADGEAGAGRVVTYWDDLSHGTEHGETKLYDDVICEVRELATSTVSDLTHHGLDEIESVVAAAGGRTDGSDASPGTGND